LEEDDAELLLLVQEALSREVLAVSLVLALAVVPAACLLRDRVEPRQPLVGLGPDGLLERSRGEHLRSGEVEVALDGRAEASHAPHELAREMRRVAARHGVMVPSSGAADLALGGAVQLRVLRALRPARVRLLQRHDVRPGEHLVDPVELRVVRHLLRRMLTLEKVQPVPQLAPAEVGRWLAGDVPSLEEVERRLGHGVQQWIPVPHDGPVLEPAHLVRLAVVHDHDHRGARCRPFVRQLSRQAGLAPQQHVVGEEEVDGGAQGTTPSTAWTVASSSFSS